MSVGGFRVSDEWQGRVFSVLSAIAFAAVGAFANNIITTRTMGIQINDLVEENREMRLDLRQLQIDVASMKIIASSNSQRLGRIETQIDQGRR